MSAGFLNKNRVQFSHFAAHTRKNIKLGTKKMKIILVIWLIFSILVSILVIAAFMRSSQLSQHEGVTENYEDWDKAETTQELFPHRAERQQS